MSVPPSVRLSFPAVVSRLRAAGCVFAEDEAELLLSTARSDDRLAAMVEQRVSGLPLEQVLGWAELCGLRIAVDPGVFVPRRRSELLVRQAAALAPPTAVVVDLCCGTGALGVALAATLYAVPGRPAGSVELYAADIEPAAVRCASRNVAPFGGRVFQGDLYHPLPVGLRGRVDVLIANAPYVPTEEIGLLPAEARLYEPQVALDGGADGLDVQRRVAEGAPQWLAPGGCLLIETSERQAELTAELFARSGLLPRIVVDEDRYATVVIGTSTAQTPGPASA